MTSVSELVYRKTRSHPPPCTHTHLNMKENKILGNLMVIYCIKTNIRYSTYKLVAAGHRQNGSPHPESHTETARPLLERDKDRNILKLTAFNRDKYAKKDITAVVKRSEAGSVKRSQPNKVGVFCFRDRM